MRKRLARWLLGSNDDPADPAPPNAFGAGPAAWVNGGELRPTPSAPAESAPAPVPARPATNGTLVVGSAEYRIAQPELPAFYRPPAPPPAPAPAARPYDDPGLLTRVGSYAREDLHEAWRLISDRSEMFVRTFYAELYLRLPEAMFMFPSGMTQQREDFGRILVQWVLEDDPEALAGHLQQLGADHRKFAVEPAHYEVAGQAFVSAWKTLAGPRWAARHEVAVLGSYTRLASVMLDGAMKSLHQPASWSARVIEHHRVLRDFAVIRIQPDAPYAFRAGQYLTLELASRPREWRQMSIASAPRPDNTFEIHVRAIGASGVSANLVMHTQPGDRLRLGPPRGNDLVVEPGTVPGGVLCVASGTGAAPITAVVESMLDWPERKPVYAFVGGRTGDDIYPVRRLNEIIHAHDGSRFAQVHGVVSDDPQYPGYHGRVESLVPKLANWAELGVDVLVSGPNSMIATTVRNLTDAGVPFDKLHFDQYEEVA